MSTTDGLYVCPGTRLQQCNDPSDHGECLYTAIGNAMQNAGHASFPERARCLAKRVKSKTYTSVKENRAVQEAMINVVPGRWRTANGTTTPDEYAKMDHMGRAFDFHLFLLHSGGSIVVHDKATNNYMRYLPFNPNGADVFGVCPTEILTAQEVQPADVVLIHTTGSYHWTRAIYNSKIRL